MTPTLPIPLLLVLLLTLPHAVHSHGYLSKIAIDGTTYTGPYVSGSDTQPSPQNSTIRQVADISPVKGASNPDLVCGLSASTAKLEASAKPGSVVEVWWDGGGGQNWPHEVGPVMAYLAACEGVSDCTTFDASGAQWFKVDQMGIEGDGSWYQAVFQKSGSLTLTLPSNLPSGHYLLRSEIIALHVATSVGGAEFYPACVQLNVQGGSGSLNPSPTVKFPGAYGDKDPGIYVPDVYDPGFVYTFPGGPVSNFAATADSSGDPPAGLSANSSAASAGSGSGSGSSSGSSPSSSLSSPSPSPSPPPPPPASSSSSSRARPSSTTTPAGSGPGSSSPAAPTSPAGTSVTGNKRICKLAKPDAAALRRRKRELGHGLGVGKSWGFGAFGEWVRW